MSNLHKAVSVALPYAQSLAQSGLRLALPANSEFVSLVRAASPEGGVIHGETKENFLFRVSQNSDADQFNIHNEVNGALHQELVDVVRAHIRNAQEVAKLCVTGIAAVKGYLEQQPDTSATGRFSIIEDPLLEIVEDDHFQELLQQPISNVGEVRNPNLVNRPRTEAEIIAMLVKAGIDAKLLVQACSFFALDENSTPRNVLEEIYRGMFVGDYMVTRNYTFRNLAKVPAGERAFVAYVAYYIAEALRIEVPEDANGDLNVFTRDAADCQAYYHRAMVSAFNEKKAQIEAGQLILDPNYSNHAMVVDKSVYAVFLESGGAPEMVLGVKIANLGFYMAAEVTANAKSAAEAWNTFARLNSATAENERRDFLRAIYKAVWDELGENVLPFEKDKRSMQMGLFGQMTAEVYEWLNKQNAETLRDVECTIEYLLGTIRFSYTPARIYLREMKANRAAHGNTDAREDSLVATIKYLAMYAATQIMVTHVHSER